ncbi:MAG: choice-of-anchor J domain-containing protein [Muribaculaceae bacterium]|nr:choice-of-anchor J domain-containing protein [Muribaculaceae bacterium]
MNKLQLLFCGSAMTIAVTGAIFAAESAKNSVKQEEAQTRIVACLLSGSGVTSSDLGLYSFDVNNPSDRILVLKGPVASYGGVEIDGVYYCNKKTSWMGMFNFYDVLGYDLSTGEEILDYDEDDVTAYFAQGGMSLDPISGDAIGIFYDAEMQNRQLALVSYGPTSPSKNILAELSDPNLNFSAFAVDGQGGCWAISTTGDLYSIDRQSGECVNIGPTGFVPQAVGGAVINPANGKMYWTVSPADGTGRLIEVNLSTGVGTQLALFEDNAQWNGLYIPGAETAPQAPGRCSDLEVNFEDTALSGTINFKAPSTFYDGNPGNGNLKVFAFVNGEKIGESQASWGSDISMDVDLSSNGAGWFDFMVYSSNDSGNGPRTKIKHIWIGSDAPSTPEPSLNYENGKMVVSWKQITTGLNGGAINQENVRYSVFDKDTTLIAKDITGLNYEISVNQPPQGSAKAYQYIVKASCGELSSPLSKTNTIALGAVKPPYETVFTKPGLDAFTIIDGNGDGLEWSLYNESEVGISIHYSEDLDMDDWFISPPLDLEEGKAYAIGFCTYSMESYYAERIEVKWGKDNTSEAMTNVILPPTDLPCMASNPLRVIKYICPEETGRYFIGFHGISDKDKFDLILSEFNVGSAVSALAPAQCTDMTVEADPEGESKATVSFKTPGVALNGSALTNNVKVEVYRDNVLVKTFESLTPGADASFIDNVNESGLKTYMFLPSNSHGVGEAASISAYVGFHLPEAPSYVDIQRTNVEGEVNLQWGIVTKDIEGIDFPSGSVVYNVYPSGSTTAVATGLTGNSYTFMAVDPGKQDMVGYEVRAQYGNLIGEPATTINIPVGTPYNGLWETGDFGKYVWGISSAGGSNWTLMDDTPSELPDSYDGDGTYFGSTGTEAGDFGVLFSGLVSLEDLENPSLSFATYHIAGGSVDQNEIVVSVKLSNSEEWIEVWHKTVSEVAADGGEWGVATIPLSAFAGNVIQVQFTATSVSYPLTLVDGIKISNGLRNNLAISSIKAPLRAVLGTDYNVDVIVENTGGNQSSAYEVKLYAGNVLIKTEQGNSLNPLGTALFSFQVHMSPLAESAVNIKAEVVYESDENPSDNVSRSIEVAPRDPGLPKPHTLTGSLEAGEVNLEWKEPDMGSSDGQPVTEDFEDAGSFSDSYGNWTFIDIDQSPVGGLQGTQIPGVITGVSLGSFWIWDTDQLPIGGSGVAHSGSKYLFSLFRRDNKQSDDWAISPELYGSEQTISFWAKSYSGSYPEHLQVLVSAESTNPEDFVMLEDGDILSVPNVWKKYEFTVPAGTKYFALRNYGMGAFMLMIDDVTYIPASVNENLKLSGYNVFRNGELMTSTPVAGTSWKDHGLEKGKKYTYQVTAVYKDGGESGASNKVEITGDGSGISKVSEMKASVSVVGSYIMITNPDGIDTAVFSSTGGQIYRGQEAGTTRIPVTSGIYIVQIGKRSIKVIVG